MIINVNFDDFELINDIQNKFNVVYKQKNELKKEFESNPYTKVYIYTENNSILGLIHINDIYDSQTV